MTIIIALTSILAIAVLVWFVNKITQFNICPVCAGVFLTWAWLLSAHFLGYEVNLVVPAMLMGGSVVGIMYKIEKKFSGLPASRLLLWKVMFVPAGFVAAYAVLEQLWVVLILAIASLFLLSFALLSSRACLRRQGESTSGLEKKMENCC